MVMVEGLTLLGVAVPTVLATALGSLAAKWMDHRASREIRALESRLRRNEEAYRVAQSPRVTTAVKLWMAYCEFERAVQASVNPSRIVYEPKDGTPEQKEESKRQQIREQTAAREKAVMDSWVTVNRARDEAECLLDADTFLLFQKLYEDCDSAHKQVWMTQFMRSEDATGQVEASIRALEQFHIAKKQRNDVVAAIRKIIAGDVSSSQPRLE
jgi:hypothetical protein